MPVYKINNVSAFMKVGIWKITEVPNELLERLESTGFSPLDVLPKHPQKRMQYLATRLLLHVFFKNIRIFYDNWGKPYLNNGWYISISHSSNMVAIALNKKNTCGIDIEKITPKITRIKQKFLNPNDLEKVVGLDELTLYWSAKEALYKYYGKKEVLFIEHLFIKNLEKNTPHFEGVIKLPHFTKEIPMTWERIEEYVLVCTG